MTDKIPTWQERIKPEYHNVAAIRCGHMQAEIDDLRAALASAEPAGELPPSDFETWWEDTGSLCRSGGGDYERTFAFRAWEEATRQAIAPYQAEIERLKAGWQKANQLALAQSVSMVSLSGIDMTKILTALERCVEAHYNIKHPLHNPIWNDATLAIRELKTLFTVIAQGFMSERRN